MLRRLIPVLLIAATLRGQCVTRTVPVAVTTREGAPAIGLTQADFHIEARGRQLGVVSAAPATGPHRVVVVLDTSGSITIDRENWAAVIGVAQTFAETAPPYLDLALLTFSRLVETEVRFGEGRHAVRQRLLELETTRWDKLKGFRKTAAIDAILEVVSLLQPARPGDSILLLTDADDNASVHDISQAEEALLRRGIRLFAMVLDTRLSRHPSAHSNEWVSRLAFATGGAAETYFVRQRPVVSLRSMVQNMTAFYLLEVSACPGNKAFRWSMNIGRGFHLVYPRQAVNERFTTQNFSHP